MLTGAGRQSRPYVNYMNVIIAGEPEKAAKKNDPNVIETTFVAVAE